MAYAFRLWTWVCQLLHMNVAKAESPRTGHGIGSFLNVHEQPPNISLGSQQELKAGMITSIEPGYYKEDVFGVRIESVYLVVEKDGWLSFERLTQVWLIPHPAFIVTIS